MKLKFNLGKYFIWCYNNNITPNRDYFHLDDEPIENIIYKIEPEWCNFIKPVICPYCGKEIEVNNEDN